MCDSARLLFFFFFSVVVFIPKLWHESYGLQTRTHQLGKPIFSGRYHNQFFGVRQVRGRDQSESNPRTADLHSPSYLCTTPRLLVPLIAGDMDPSTAEGRDDQTVDDRQGPCIL